MYYNHFKDISLIQKIIYSCYFRYILHPQIFSVHYFKLWFLNNSYSNMPLADVLNVLKANKNCYRGKLHTDWGWRLKYMCTSSLLPLFTITANWLQNMWWMVAMHTCKVTRQLSIIKYTDTNGNTLSCITEFNHSYLSLEIYVYLVCHQLTSFIFYFHHNYILSITRSCTHCMFSGNIWYGLPIYKILFIFLPSFLFSVVIYILAPMVGAYISHFNLELLVAAPSGIWTGEPLVMVLCS